MPRLLSRLLLLVAVHAGAVMVPALAHAQGDDISADDEGTTDDDDDVLKAPKRGKVPSHFEIKPSQRFALRHAFDSQFSVELFIRGEQAILDNPLSLRSSQAGGGLQTIYKVGATTWFLLLKSDEGFSRFYQTATRSDTELRTVLQQQFDFGDSGLSVLPRVQVAYKWSSDAQLERWKFDVLAPINYKLSDTVTLLPLIPKLAYQPYTHRSDGRFDLTMTLSAGVRWFFAGPSFLEMAFGFENRWSNVHSAELTRWKLTPEINIRVPF